ncbi:MarR family winged helix-turn-helix transcriptional regulator [Epilithonimonas hungarica]|jgi:Transcriptional regulators|uniref:DNA-binding transcriptional regulator, MarR family n=1 Tax=Epilithonimonas hungarica TaxID=454006 RepID=A0A1G7HYF5_9FLAO|nr:MarR family transcriptional regulator [Epilithonimonas hungarica]MDP9957898.1 DNA-binding MarR family transcriptional regulator [Epilithonimonas hungarica]MPT31678.1 MarR family transcriptional regulator [Chryseobacterium sp.]SDF05139.1 DNA-binding transcriptional regulator, MarR family [Epilithonimonas hungarica]
MEDLLKLDKQLCFSVYVLHREIMQCYRPILKNIGLTYPQYITMMALWEKDDLTVNQVGEILQLDNGTLTPLLKRLESKGYLERKRSKEDERVVKIYLTEKGVKLKEKATCIPIELAKAMNLDLDEMEQLKSLSDKVVQKINQ